METQHRLHEELQRVAESTGERLAAIDASATSVGVKIQDIYSMLLPLIDLGRVAQTIGRWKWPVITVFLLFLVNRRLALSATVLLGRHCPHPDSSEANVNQKLDSSYSRIFYLLFLPIISSSTMRQATRYRQAWCLEHFVCWAFSVRRYIGLENTLLNHNSVYQYPRSLNRFCLWPLNLPRHLFFNDFLMAYDIYDMHSKAASAYYTLFGILLDFHFCSSLSLSAIC